MKSYRAGRRLTRRLKRAAAKAQRGRGRIAEGVDACIHTPIVECKDPSISNPYKTGEYVSRMVLKSTGDRVFEEALKTAMPWVVEPTSGVLVSLAACDPAYKVTNRNKGHNDFYQEEDLGCSKTNGALGTNFKRTNLTNANFDNSKLDNLILEKVGKSMSKMSRKSDKSKRSDVYTFRQLVLLTKDAIVAALRWHYAAVTPDCPFVIHTDLHANNLLYAEGSKMFKIADWGRRIFCPKGRGVNNSNLKAAIHEYFESVFRPLFIEKLEGEFFGEDFTDEDREYYGNDVTNYIRKSERNYSGWVQDTIKHWQKYSQHPDPYLRYTFVLDQFPLSEPRQEFRIETLRYWTLTAIINSMDMCVIDSIGTFGMQRDELFYDNNLYAHFIMRGVPDTVLDEIYEAVVKDPCALKGMKILDSSNLLGRHVKVIYDKAIASAGPTISRPPLHPPHRAATVALPSSPAAAPVPLPPLPPAPPVATIPTALPSPFSPRAANGAAPIPSGYPVPSAPAPPPPFFFPPPPSAPPAPPSFFSPRGANGAAPPARVVIPKPRRAAPPIPPPSVVFPNLANVNLTNRNRTNNTTKRNNKNKKGSNSII